MNIEVETLNEPFVLAISLDKVSEEPLHQQISDPLRTKIFNNEFSPRVTLPPIHRKVSLTSLCDGLKNAGFEPETEILQYEIQFASPEAASLLDCEDDCEIARIKRLRYSRGRPLAILNNILVASKAPAPSTLTESGLYEQLKADGFTPSSGFQQVAARRATPEEAALLLIEDGAAVITVERTVYAENDEVVNIEEDIYDASQYALVFSLHAA